MKKLLSICLMAALLLMCAACAEEYLGSMQVVNCEEWVSLRVQPDKSSNRLVKVPFGTIVENCTRYSDDWIYAEYDGYCGYILSDYLQEPFPTYSGDMYAQKMSIDELRGSGDEILRYEEGGFTVIAVREFDRGETETLRVGCYRGDSEPVWGWVTETNCCTELNATEAFIGGDGEYRQVLIYNSQYGLAAVDFYDGSENWLMDWASFGGSICHAVAPDGVNYIAGFYGPDPVAVSMDGEVLWESSVEDESIYWPYEIQFRDDSLYVKYDSESEIGHYAVAFDYETGEVLAIESVPYLFDEQE